MKAKKHFTFEQQEKLLLEQVPNINGTEARVIAKIISCWTFAMIVSLCKALVKIAKGTI